MCFPENSRGKTVQVVIVSDFGDVNGGAAKVAITSARGLVEAGIAVTYVCALAPVSQILDHPGITVHCLNFESVWARRNPLGAAAQGIWHRPARQAMDDILATLPRNETIVHFHQWTKAFSPSVLASPARWGLPSVVSMHDYFLVCPNGAYYRYADAKPCQVAPMSSSCIASQCDRRGYMHKTIRLLRHAASERATARAGSSLSVLSVSPFAEAVMDEFLPKRHARFVVGSPIDIERSAPVAVAKNADFLFAGRLTEEKGVQRLAEIARDANLPLTIAGDGPLLNSLRQMGGTIRCTGWLDEAGLAALMGQARALVFPSTWYETGGLVVLEALARGLPVIVSRNTAAADFIKDGVNGYLIDPGDVRGLRASMLKLTDAETVSRMGAEAYRRYWVDPQTLAAHTDKLLAVYRTVLVDHRARIDSPAVGHA